MVLAKRIVLLGPPAAGKGTFSSQLLKIQPNLVHISTGDIFRDLINKNDPISSKIKEYMEKGSLIPDKYVIRKIQEILETDEVKNNGWIMDGFPRSSGQQNFLDTYKVDLCLLLEVDEELIKKRVLGRYSCQKCNAIYNKYFLKPEKEGICDKCGAEIKFVQRTDDNVETFKMRLDLYNDYSGPIIEHYKNQGVLKTVDTEDTLELSEEDIKKILGI